MSKNISHCDTKKKYCTALSRLSIHVIYDNYRMLFSNTPPQLSGKQKLSGYFIRYSAENLGLAAHLSHSVHQA